MVAVRTRFTGKVAKATLRLQWPTMNGQGDGIE